MSSDPFFDRLRTEPPSTLRPTHRDFSEDEWRQQYQACGTTSLRDEALFSAGLFCASELRILRKEWDHRLFAGLSKNDVRLLAVGFLNFSFAQVDSGIRTRTDEIGSDVRRFHEQIGRPIPFTSGDGAHYDAASLWDASINSVQRWLMFAERITVEQSSPHQSPVAYASEARIFFGKEHWLSQIWQAVLWEDFRLEDCGDHLLFAARDEERTRFQAVALHRDEMRYTENILHAETRWRHELTEEDRTKYRYRTILRVRKSQRGATEV